MMEFVNGKDDIPYEMENNSHVWNHQPALVNLYPISRHPHLWLRKDTPMDADIWAAARTKSGPHHQPDNLLWYIMISLP